MTQQRVSAEDMKDRIVRFKDIEGEGSPVGVPLMFIDSILAGTLQDELRGHRGHSQRRP